MPGPQPRLHLPFADWPETDKIMWQSELDDDDPFSDGIAARLAKTTLHKYWMGWRRFLGSTARARRRAGAVCHPLSRRRGGRTNTELLD